MKRLGVLISGRGSNLQALIDAQRAGTLGGTIALVVSNVEGVPGLDRARAAGIPAVCRAHLGRSREDHDQELVAVLASTAPSSSAWPATCGSSRPCSSGPFPAASSTCTLRCCPPSRPDAQRQAWEHGVKVSGATCTSWRKGSTAVPILAQEAVPVEEDDTVERLSARILEAEHRIYPRAVRDMLEGRYKRDGRRMRVRAGA